jgi:hypothetical protein
MVDDFIVRAIFEEELGLRYTSPANGDDVPAIEAERRPARDRMCAGRGRAVTPPAFGHLPGKLARKFHAFDGAQP